MPAKPKFDPAQAITNELISILERGTMPWRKPWKAGASTCPLRHSGEPYQGVNNFLLTMRTLMHGYASPFWMTMRQANELDARIRKGQKSSLVVYYGQSYKDGEDKSARAKPSDEKQDGEDSGRVIQFMKSYRVFNADQIEGLEARFHPDSDDRTQPGPEPIPHMQAFFDAIGAEVMITGREAKYVPALDRIYMPELSLFETAHDFYSTMAHEHIHLTKSRHRLNRSYGDAKFGNTAYSREEVVADLGALFLGQHLGYAPHTIENTAAYIDHWLRVIKSDKRAIFALSGDAKRASEYLIEASEKGARDVAA